MAGSNHGADNGMHHEVDWMTPADRRIVSEISQYGGWIKPASLSLNLPFTRKYVADRCRVLSENGLVDRHSETPAYRINDLGTQFLRDELEPVDLTADESGHNTD